MRALLAVALTKPVQAVTEEELQHIGRTEVEVLKQAGWIVDEFELIDLPEA